MVYQPFEHIPPRGKPYDLPLIKGSTTQKLTFGSVCSGIEAVSVAWKNIATPLWFSEIDNFPCAVLAHHYPDVPNLGDMTTLADKIQRREIAAPDILVGGTPCQAFSVAGKRESLDDIRGNLTLELIKIADSIDEIRKQDGKQPVIILWENVPGVLNTKDNAFGHFLGGLAGEFTALQPPRGRWTGAGVVRGKREIVWRILDAQYFGVAQRRKRVFVMASAGATNITKILLEPRSLQRDIAPCQSTQQNATAYFESSFGTYRQSDISGTIRTNGGTQGQGAETIICVHGTQDPIVSHTTAHCLGTNNGQENILFDAAERRDGIRVYKGLTPTLTAKMGTGGGNVIRKLTPKECERLQGFPDNYTQIPYRNKPAEQCPDSPRYKAIGNSMAVPVIQWIGQRIINYVNGDK